MSKLNKDILYLIFEELQDDTKTLYSSLSVNKTWCELIVPILWRNPWKFLTNRSEILLINVIISHLSDESKNNLFIQDNDLFKVLFQKLLFNYISFCRHLNLSSISWIIYFIELNYSKSNISVIKSEILNLFINENTRFTHLYIPQRFDYQIHLIPGAKHCFSEIVFLSCNTNRVSGNVLIGLAEICQSIKELELSIESRNNNYEIIKLIDASKKLINVRLKTSGTGIVLCTYPIRSSLYYIEESFHIILENSLMRHAHTIQYFNIDTPPATGILSSLVNLKRLELYTINRNIKLKFNSLEDNTISLPSLQILKTDISQTSTLRNLIVNTNGNLTKISIDNIFRSKTDNENIIKAIYQNCPNLMFLKLVFIIENILELEKLLIKCQCLNGLYFHILNLIGLDKLFEMLTRSSPTSLFKFKFDIISRELITPESFKLFINNWKGRHPMLLQISPYGCTDLIDSEVIKRFDYLRSNWSYSEDFEW
ncbi:uncharacterized protein OCT59_016053 [Rhizophagus irregularis]|uniref:F-box domain-containing protein n=2 Tax=Rhizophagus irregularis TaxID=588596 RepID=U9UKR4_RHIID|nr:hypothetical protein GLOIN_2v1765881 [Rhizophagus irregularis DAOM 181602=DAOM 197198]EXX64181.1 hypothetical protein RirG_145310 [Rhizophagus irregularis DAOM 197198w]POG79081.1 hypothetical protein GLOIN_2v1765881 [Rhizophagus irregularis DAOM 181602=DAOM 197198]UZO23722.1 hypothetical protein OCT59_016053 [Rhizophagus irregularis]CAG8645204.1 16934_t:CDS:1 [Rhizophagus irregularis]|eukprot:XP_025185947.1 hypothetical protein GLOIN_2v1765881 [Rhizophagus irregularis DAOM 181602=DAOM 197198]